MGIKKNQYDAPALRKGIKLIEMMCDAETPMGISEIARQLDLNTHMVTRLIKTFLDAGWLVQGEPCKYQMGLRPFRFTSRPVKRMDFHAAAMGPLQQLWRETGECVHLGILDGQEALLIEALDTRRHSVKVSPMAGAGGPLHIGAGSKLLLAYGEKRLLAELLARGLERRTKHTLCTERKLRADLKASRERGYSLDLQEGAEGILCLSAPVFDHTGQIVGTITITVLTMYYTAEEMEARFAEKVVEAGKKISAAMGYCPEKETDQ